MRLRSNQLGLIINLLLLLSVAATTTNAADFDVMKHAANPGGAVDCTAAFIATWKEACAAPGPGRSNFVVPKGNFLVGPVTFEGPCKTPVDFLIQGTVKADPNPAKFPTPDWVVFQHLTDTHISGGGTFDGQGQQAWKANDCDKNPKCRALPINVRFNFLTNVHVSQITSANSKNFNVNIVSCKNITLESFTVNNPGDAPNTDGIHIGESAQVSILNSTIGTGDDCVSIGPGSVDVKVLGTTCGPGHGFSVGSLGKYPNEHDVSGITVRNCTLTKTLNGVRIKSWAKAANSAANAASKATTFIFEDIIMNDVQNPILIDQLYCPYVKCTQDSPSQVAISDVLFNKITGTTTTKTAINIVCSKGVPCKDVKIGDINLKYTGTNGTAESIVTFTTPVLTGTQVPPVKAGAAGAAGPAAAAAGPAAAGAAGPAAAAAGPAGAAKPAAGAAPAGAAKPAAPGAAPAGAAKPAAPGAAPAAKPAAPVAAPAGAAKPAAPGAAPAAKPAAPVAAPAGAAKPAAPGAKAAAAA